MRYRLAQNVLKSGAYRRKKSHIYTQRNVQLFRYNIYALMPADDPLRKKVYDIMQKKRKPAYTVYSGNTLS
ncbi:MAG TPA: hypothetical protein DHV89_03575 [Ruminococcus sp.]|nr:hypothetical protein [Ruminococcus sp.]